MSAKTDLNLGDLSKKTSVELQELIQRQEHLLKNRTLLKSLPDLNVRVGQTLDKLRRELECKLQIEQVTNMMKGVRLGPPSREHVEALEWQTSGKTERSSGCQVLKLLSCSNIPSKKTSQGNAVISDNSIPAGTPQPLLKQVKNLDEGRRTALIDLEESASILKEHNKKEQRRMVDRLLNKHAHVHDYGERFSEAHLALDDADSEEESSGASSALDGVDSD